MDSGVQPSVFQGVIYSPPSRSVKGMPVERLHKRCMHLTNYSVAPAADTQQCTMYNNYKTFAPSRHHANMAKWKPSAARVFFKKKIFIQSLVRGEDPTT